MPQGGTSGLPAITRQEIGSASTLRFEFLRRIGSGFTYIPQKSTHLSVGSWAALSTQPLVTAVDEFWERVVYEEPVNPVTVPACFGRVQVDLP